MEPGLGFNHLNMGGIKETSSSGHPTVKIVLERCPRTEKALKELQLQNYHLDLCSVCGGNEELIDLQHYGWTPAQSQLFKKRVLEWTLEISGGGDSLTTHDDDDEFGWSCEGCMAQFEMLALVQRRITDLKNQEKEIVSQLKKTIGDRLGVISHPHLPGKEPEATSLVSDVDLSNPTHMMADESSDGEVDLDLKPIILEEGFLVDEVENQFQPDGDDDDGFCNDTVGGADLISQEEETNHSDQGGTMGETEDQPSPKKSRRCKARATQVISAILQNDDEIDDDDENDEYSPTDESDTDSDNTNGLDPQPHIGENRYNRNGGGMSSNPSKPVQNGDKHICKVCGKRVVKLSQHMEIHRSERQIISCETCHKTFSTEGSLSRHRNGVHLKQLPHKCQKCGKGFCRAQNLQRHLKTRIPCTELVKNKKFVCPICKDGFTSKSNFTTHTRTAHNGEKRSYCPHPKCRYRYFDKTKLEHHLEIRHPQDEISCTICNEKFSSVKEKLDHIKSSHEFCNQSFPNKVDLDEHQTTDHTEDQPYVCTKCGNKFSWKKELGLHLQNTTCNEDGEG